MHKHFLVSATEVGALTTGLHDGSQGSPPPFLIAVQDRLDFSVSALHSEYKPTPISWCMRTKRKTPLSGEPLFWGGYLELSLSQRSHCCYVRLVICIFSIMIRHGFPDRDSSSFGSDCGSVVVEKGQLLQVDIGLFVWNPQPYLKQQRATAHVEADCVALWSNLSQVYTQSIQRDHIR